MSVDGGGTGIDPNTGRVFERSDHLVQQTGAADARIINGAAIRGVVAAIDAASGKVDTNVALLQIRNPGARRESVPWEDAPRSRPRMTAEYRDGVTLLVKVPGEDMTHLPAAARYDDVHGR